MFSRFRGSAIGSTPAFGAGYLGSSPSPGANFSPQHQGRRHDSPAGLLRVNLRAGEIFPTHVVATRVCYSLAAMRTKSARKLTTEYQLNMSAQRALMRRPYSIHEMKQYLERRAEKKELIPPVIARPRELNYLDDARYALEYARHHAQGRRQGRYRLARELP